MQRILETIDRISTGLGIALIVPMMVILFMNILLRQFSGGFSWYMETAQFLNVWSVFAVAIGLCATNDHLHIDAVESMLKGTPRRVMRLFIAMLTIFFLCVLGYSFVIIASRSRQRVNTMQYLKMAWIYWPIPIMCFLSAISCALHAIWDFMNFGKGKEIRLLTAEDEK